eukprot:362090_1
MLPLWTVDAFTTKPFSGNPAAVCIIDKYDDELCQKIAAEINLSETAFLVPLSNDSSSTITNKWQLRWWTPETEVNFCGHATLAATHLLSSEGFVNTNKAIEFETKSGIFYASKPDPLKNEYLMDFPALLEKPFNGNLNILPQIFNIKKSQIMNVTDSGEDLLIE